MIKHLNNKSTPKIKTLNKTVLKLNGVKLMLTAYELCEHQLTAVLQDMDWCISNEEMDEDEREKLQKLYDSICSLLPA